MCLLLNQILFFQSLKKIINFSSVYIRVLRDTSLYVCISVWGFIVWNWTTWLWRLRSPEFCNMRAWEPRELRVKVPVWVQRQEETSVPGWNGQAEPEHSLLLFSGPQLAGWGPCTLGRATCFTRSVNSNVHLTQKHSPRHTQHND